MSDWVRLFIMLYMTVVGLSMGAAFVESRFFTMPNRMDCLQRYNNDQCIGCTGVSGGGNRYPGAGISADCPFAVPAAFYAAQQYPRMASGLSNFFSAVLFCNLIHHGGGLIFYLTGQQFWSLLSAYLLLTAGMFWFLMRWLRPLFYRVCLLLNRGWWMMCLIIAMYYWIGIYLIPGYVGESLSSTMLKPAISCLMIGFYAVLMVFLSWYSGRRKHGTMRKCFPCRFPHCRSVWMRSAERKKWFGVERHDLRHRLLTVGELVKKGKTRAAPGFYRAV